MAEEQDIERDLDYASVCPTTDELDQFIAEELQDEAQIAFLQWHLTFCKRCQRYAEEGHQL